MIRQQDEKILETQIESTEDFYYQNLLIMKYLEVNWGLFGTPLSLEEINNYYRNSLNLEIKKLRKAGRELKENGFEKNRVKKAVQLAINFKKRRVRILESKTPDFYIEAIKRLIKNDGKNDLTVEERKSLKQLFNKIREIDRTKGLGLKQKKERRNIVLKNVLSLPEFSDRLIKIASKIWIETDALFYKRKHVKNSKIGAPPIKLINEILNILEPEPIANDDRKPKYYPVQAFIREVINPVEYPKGTLQNRIFELRINRLKGG